MSLHWILPLHQARPSTPPSFAPRENNSPPFAPAALESQLPPELQESLRDVTRYQDLQALTQQWQESDGNPANLQQMRENLVGREAGERLAKLDQERAEWQRRVDSWLREREAILSNPGISDADKERQIDSRRSRLFNEQEQIRVRLLE